MIDTGYLFSKDKKRIFVNTCLGCAGNCSYCYLKKMGYSNNTTNIPVKKAEELIDEIESSGISKDTLVTLGCFSECWDDSNKPETIKLIKYFLERGNQVQLATKKEITLEEARQFADLIQYSGQLVVFVSSATISQWSSIEKGTDEPKKRFKTFEISKELDIPTVLYMKPTLKGVTIKDIDLYKEVINRYGIKDVVVGSIFGEERTEEPVHFSNKGLLFYNPISDELQLKMKLMQMSNLRVFSRSSKVVQYYKDKNRDIGEKNGI